MNHPIAGVSFSPDASQGAALSAAGVATWGAGVEVHAAGPIPKSAFTQQLELQAGIDFDAGGVDAGGLGGE